MLARNFTVRNFFVVKHKSKYRCESAINFDLGFEIIKENCNFAYYFNKTNINPAVLDGGNEIILAKWPNNKHIICNVNNDIPSQNTQLPLCFIKLKLVM